MIVSDLEVEVVKKKIKNMHLYILPPDGNVRVTAPKWVSDSAIEAFVESKYDWIKKQQQVVQNRAKNDVSYSNGDVIYIWGECYKLFVVKDNHFSLSYDEQLKVAYMSVSSEDKETNDKHLLEWYREQLKIEVAYYLPLWESKTNMHASSWQTKNMKSRWGTCNTTSNKIWLNVQLAKRPKICLEYVILHELAHTVVPNHSKEFKAILDLYMPDWKMVQKELNNFNIH